MAAGTEPRSTEPLIHRPHTRVSSVGLAKKERLRSKFPNWLRTHFIDDLQGIWYLLIRCRASGKLSGRSPTCVIDLCMTSPRFSIASWSARGPLIKRALK